MLKVFIPQNNRLLRQKMKSKSWTNMPFSLFLYNILVMNEV